MRDWIGELTNQFMGRVKTKLLAHGVEVFVTTPIVLSGVRIQPLPRGHVEPLVFSSHAGSVLTWIELETHPAFVLGSEHPGFNGEGDVIVF
jgi:CheY-specific phosphatase CheX